MSENKYIFLGDRLTDINLRNKVCFAVKRGEKCIRGRNANMLVQFENGSIQNVPGRRLRKLPLKCKISNWSCPYHACMSDDCQKHEVLKNDCNWGKGKCE